MRMALAERRQGGIRYFNRTQRAAPFFDASAAFLSLDYIDEYGLVLMGVL